MKNVKNLLGSSGLLLAATLWLTQAGATEPSPSPDLSLLEPQVAAQLRLTQETLTKALGTNQDGSARATLYGELGRLYQAYALNEAATGAFGHAAELNPLDYRWHYHLALLNAEAGRADEAEAGYRRALDINPDLPVAHYRLAQLYRQTNRLDKANTELAIVTTTFARQAPQFAALLAERGELRLAQGRYSDAVDDLKPALTAVPAADRLHYPLGMAYRALGENQQARAELAQAGKAGLKFPDPLLDSLSELLRGERVQRLRGQTAFRAGDYAAAVESFRNALAAESDSAAARVDLSAALSAQGQNEEAMKLLQEAISIEPRSATAQYNLGLLQLSAGNVESAADHLQKATALRPDDAEAYLPLARALQAAGHGTQALEQYARACEHNPQDSAVWSERADLQLQNGMTTDALATLEEGHRQLPYDGAIAHALARMLATDPQQDLRDGARAFDLAQRVFEAQPSARHGETLAAALAENARCVEAAQLQQQVLEYARKSSDAAWIARSESTLHHYRNDKPCRP